MGLDMIAYYRNSKGKDFEFHSWRKHPDLHGWFESLYRYKSGDLLRNFNQIELSLTSSDLDMLESDVLNRVLPHTDGFFFGESSYDAVIDDLVFIMEAKSIIKKGKPIFYIADY